MSTAVLGLVALVWIVVAMAVAVRLGSVLRRHQPAAPPAYATFTPPPPGARYLACHTTACGHMTTLHTPHGDAWKCAGCGHTKGGQ